MALFELIMGLCLKGATNQKLPTFVRALLIIIVELEYIIVAGCCALFVSEGIKAFKNKAYLGGSIAMALAALFVGIIIYLAKNSIEIINNKKVTKTM